MKTKRTFRLRFGVFLFALAILGMAVVPVAVRYILEKRLGGERYAVLRSFFDDPVSIPEEWRRPKVFSADLVEAASRDVEFRRDWETPYPDLEITVNKTWANQEELTPEVVETIRPYLQDLEPYFESFGEIVSHPDYEIGLWDTFGISFSQGAWMNVTAFRKPAGVYGRVLAMDGECEKAFATVLPTLQFVEGEPPTTLTAKMLGIVCVGIGVGNSEDIYPLCDDPETLEGFLKDLNSIDIWKQTPTELDLSLEAAVSNLVVGDATGSAPLLARKEPVAFFAREAEDLYMDRYYPFREPWQYRIQRVPPVSAFIQLLAIDEWQWSMGVGLDGITSQFMYARINFDLLRLNIANRILELRGREKATNASGLVPEFFEDHLVHPETGEAYEWDEEEGEFVHEEE